jgi:hypothetical protein
MISYRYNFLSANLTELSVYLSEAIRHLSLLKEKELDLYGEEI